ncbi:nucleotidyltransferase domain-containing protein [Sulfurovum sp. NBC37-1]|uniref:nucleotidyltransferase domain-containing protein n=1 Tax=Sulfurovum sp. (strain NBC37-1) TaxID=387093 RepID=UPI0001587B1B|nr:nucleotidyltransferase family protein [Sulfurovum sp. NBC37-1]BAF72466.1 conserved hypothetical protein [Sulfurovum sp. NBC37-1]
MHNNPDSSFRNTHPLTLLELSSDTSIVKTKKVCNAKNDLSLELLFLIACCQTEPSQNDIDTIRSFLNAEHLTLHTLISLANQHGILPLIYKTLSSLNAELLTLNTFLSELKARYMSISKRNMFMSAELIHIMTLFEKNHIDMLAFKGPALAKSAYGDITLRQFGDLDILVKPKDLPKIMECMLSEGYVPDVKIPPKESAYYYTLLTTIGFDKRPNNMRIEIHWELLSQNYAVAWKSTTLWQCTDEVEINHRNIPAMAFEKQLIYLCLHGSKHLFERIEWICDIDRSVRMQEKIDWHYIITTSKELGVFRMLLLGLSLASDLIGLSLPKEITQAIRKDSTLPGLKKKIVSSYSAKHGKNTVDRSYFFTVMQMREHPSDRLRFAWQALFATQFNDINYIRLPRYLYFLYPLVRLYRLVEKYFTKK